MVNFARNSVLYNGISDYIPQNISSFTQGNIDRVIKIDDDFPKIDEIIKVNVSYVINNTKMVKTAIGTSLEGQKLTGYKYLSEGVFNVRIDFCSDEENGSIYTYKDIIHFNNATTLNEDIGMHSRFISNVYIEDIHCEKASENEILINITFLFAIDEY